ncbi:MAG: BatA and WFA domain-containing protein [Pirellulales bacterium]
MSIINMLTWWQWALLAAVPPAIVLLYFLKLKRTPLEVPSTYLWHKSIEDLHVNSIWQRLRTSLLLILQLLLVTVVMVALVRPGWSGSRLVGNRYVFLIDNSASMSATDTKPSRLAEAKRRAAELIEQMASGDVAMIVSFSDAARVEQVFTDNRRELLDELEAIRPTNRLTLLGEALRVAAGLANSERSAQSGRRRETEGLPATLYLFSDGRFPDVENFRLGNLKPIFVPIGTTEPANVGITAFSTRRREDRKDHVQAFGRLENFGPKKLTAEVELYHNDSLLDASTVELEPNASGGVVFELGELPTGVLKLRTRSGGALAVDDEAWAAVEPPKRGRVLLVTPGNDALEMALATDSAALLAEVNVAGPDVLESKEYQEKAAGGHYALVIYDQCQPREMPQANTLFIGRLPPQSSWAAAADSKAEGPQIIDVETTHPLMQLIDMSNVRFAEATMLKPPEGSTVLVSTEAGPLLAIAPRGSFEDAVLGAEIVGVEGDQKRYANTDWPLRVSFPVFILNALGYLSGSAAGAIPSVQPGHSVALRAFGSSGTLAVRTPGGKSITLSPEHGAALPFGGTDELGIYVVDEVGEPPRRFAVNLFDSAESNIPPRSAVQIGFDVVTGQAVWEGGRFELWKPLLAAVLGILCLEWYIYNRRVYV